MTDLTLKPCPFCKSNKIIYHYSSVGKYLLHCDECECNGPYSNSDKKEEAAKIWNDRVENNDLSLKEIQEICRKNHITCNECPMYYRKAYETIYCYLSIISVNKIDLTYLEQKIKEYKQNKEKK